MKSSTPCKRCGDFTKSKSGYCTKHRRYAAEEKATPIVKICEVCQKPFLTSRSNARMCSILCRNKLVARMPRPLITYGTKKCEQCGNDYTSHSPHSRYCSPSCVSKANYRRNIDRVKEYDRKRIRRTTIGLNIRNEHLQKPYRQTKWVWDGIGLWSQKYPDIDNCLECNTHVFRHESNGVCEYCYDKLKEKDPEKRRILAREWARRAREKGYSPKKEADSWINIAEEKKIPITPKIENLLQNLHELEGQRLKV